MRKLIFIALAVACSWHPALAGEQEPTVVVGSKKFTESVILGELATLLARDSGAEATHREQLGGTRVLWNAIVGGDIDVYPEYTGTIAQEILAGRSLESEQQIRQAVAEYGIVMSKPVGFNNTYAIGMRKERAEELGIETISDLRKHPELVFGFTNEFMDRQDGWPGLRSYYRLPQADVKGLDHDLAYRGLAAGSIDVTDLYSTDAEIRYYDLKVLKDDRQYFPKYEAVLLYRQDMNQRAPGAVKAMLMLVGNINESQMIKMNAAAKIERQPEGQIAARFLHDTFGKSVEVREESFFQEIWSTTKQHICLVSISLAAAILLAVPLGVIAAKLPTAGQAILGVVGIIQTIPALALLVFMIPLMGIGGPPAMVALFLYSLLPIVRNTYTGLHDIATQSKESAAALGLPARARLRLVELPMASRSILAGVKTSAVINVGTATLGALIGAGGYGQPILTGIRLDDIGLILQGAVPAAVLAIMVQGLFELVERFLVPRGLRLKAEKAHAENEPQPIWRRFLRKEDTPARP